MDLASIDHLLTTTRTVRKRLDLTRPVDPAVIQECLEIAIQAPTGGNIARYHFIVITDPDKRLGLAKLYRKAFYDRWMPGATKQSHFSEIGARNLKSMTYLAEHLHEVPVHIMPCVQRARVRGGSTPQGSELSSILPAAWSLMLALRARGIGAAWTTIHTMYAQETATLLGIPTHIRQAALLPVAYFTGEDFKPASRLPVRERTYWNAWGQAR